MLKRRTQYGLRVLAHLARQPGGALSGREIARATGVPRHSLLKILRVLGICGFVTAQKGSGGGFTLKKGVLESPIAEVVAALQPVKAKNQSSCLIGAACCADRERCPLGVQWKIILEKRDKMLRQTKIGRLAECLETANPHKKE